MGCALLGRGVWVGKPRCMQHVAALASLPCGCLPDLVACCSQPIRKYEPRSERKLFATGLHTTRDAELPLPACLLSAGPSALQLRRPTSGTCPTATPTPRTTTWCLPPQ